MSVKSFLEPPSLRHPPSTYPQSTTHHPPLSTTTTTTTTTDHHHHYRHPEKIKFAQCSSVQENNDSNTDLRDDSRVRCVDGPPTLMIV
jgi:hypothetical protein